MKVYLKSSLQYIYSREKSTGNKSQVIQVSTVYISGSVCRSVRRSVCRKRPKLRKICPCFTEQLDKQFFYIIFLSTFTAAVKKFIRLYKLYVLYYHYTHTQAEV